MQFQHVRLFHGGSDGELANDSVARWWWWTQTRSGDGRGAAPSESRTYSVTPGSSGGAGCDGVGTGFTGCCSTSATGTCLRPPPPPCAAVDPEFSVPPTAAPTQATK